jgi:methionine-rich copper-binding protein CopC
MNVRTSARREFFKGLGLLALSAASSRVTRAHAKMLRSEPKASAVLRNAPKTIELWFSELLEDQFNTIQLFPLAESAEKVRVNLAKEKPKVDPKDRTHLVLELPALDAGGYLVEYRVLSRDGHTAPGRFTFTLLARS